MTALDLEPYTSLVESEIDEFVRDIDNEILKELSGYALDGGKHIRGALSMLACEAVGGTKEDAKHVAIAIELGEAVSLVKDDINDKAELRRGKEPLYKKYGLEKAGLAVDFLVTSIFSERVLGRYQELKLSDGSNLQESLVMSLYDCIAGTAEKVIRGELAELETRASGDPVTEREYMEIISRKTGALFSAAAKMGGIAGRGSDKQVKALETYGRFTGQAFQIWDDVLDIKGHEKNMGKKIYMDIYRGVWTLPIIHAMSMAERSGDSVYQVTINSIMEGKISEGKLEIILHQILDRFKSLDYSRRKAEKFVESGKKALKPLDDTPAKAALIEIADQMIGRER